LRGGFGGFHCRGDFAQIAFVEKAQHHGSAVFRVQSRHGVIEHWASDPNPKRELIRAGWIA